MSDTSDNNGCWYDASLAQKKEECDAACKAAAALAKRKADHAALKKTQSDIIAYPASADTDAKKATHDALETVTAAKTELARLVGLEPIA